MVKIGRTGLKERELKETKFWSDEKTRSLIELMRKYEGQQRMNKLIAEEPGTEKMAEQVKIKRRLLQEGLARNGPDNAVMEESNLQDSQASPIIQPLT